MNKQMTPAEIELLQQSRLAPISAKAALVGVVRPMSPAEHSRRSRARQRDDEIVRFRGPIADLGKSINKWRWDAHSVEGCMSVHGAIERRVHR